MSGSVERIPLHVAGRPTEPPDPRDLLEILPGQIGGPFRFADLFGRSAPVEIEIGVGKGRFILEQARSRPGVDFLGLEWSLKHLRVTKFRAGRLGLRNLRLYRADARHVLSDLVPEGSCQRLHVYCPDPWPKKRHHKRRLFNPATVPHMERVLSEGGFLHISTDVREYFDEILETVSARTSLSPSVDPLFPAPAMPVQTHYEAKYVLEGRVIHRAAWARISRS
ncbi:MAG: tRNA (guanosine(46)-N7)-methyltransferase TrmB [Acidobacteria bacterium]|nr:tRNA (guanosine(46)-N7)-methyltransferase TrmB [Acidobacteriota bacterium]